MPAKKISLKVKYQRTTHKVKCDVKAADALITLKAQLFTLTNVPVDRQKIFLKGKLLTEETISGVKAKAKLSLTGTVAKMAEPPKTKTKFVEDMTPAELARLAPESVVSAGLNNLGNTCFMNSTLQCFRGVKEFKDGMKRFGAQAPTGRGPQQVLCQSWGQLYTTMDSSQKPVTPFIFTETMRTLFPQLGSRDDRGNYQQQDADECLTTILSTARQVVKVDGKSLANSLFVGRFSVETKGLDNGEMKTTTSTSDFTKLQCFIDGKISFMNDGIRKGLVEQLERRDSAGNPAVFTRTSRISKLPKVLIVQFVRFYYNRAKQQKCKMLRKVEFPEIFDVLEFCSPEKKASLLRARQELKKEKDRKLGLARRKKPKTQEKKQDSKAMDTSEDGEKKGEENKAPFPTDSSGNYELVSVVTHQGRSADSGHYIGWARKQGDDWWKFDDHKVTAVKTEDIKTLSGGADWHINYLSFYRRIDDLEGRVWGQNAEKSADQS